MTLQLGQIWPGHEKRPHRHEYEQIAMIFTGECNFYVDGVAYHLTGGCVMSIPSNAEHYIEVIGNDPVYALDIFWPKRPDRVESVPDKQIKRHSRLFSVKSIIKDSEQEPLFSWSKRWASSNTSTLTLRIHDSFLRQRIFIDSTVAIIRRAFSSSSGETSWSLSSMRI